MADLDEDGRLCRDERTVLQRVPAGHLEGEIRATLRRADRGEGWSMPVQVRVGRLGELIGYSCERRRRAVLPVGGGRVVELQSDGCLFDAPGARLVVDRDGDGTPDERDEFAVFSVGRGLLRLDASTWRFSVTADGSELTLESTPEPFRGLRPGQPAPDFRLTDLGDTVHTLGDHRGRPLLLVFWGTWCGACIDMHPRVARLAERYGLDVLGVARDPALRLWHFLSRHRVPWRNAPVDRDAPVLEAYGITSYPTYALIDAQGRLVALGGMGALIRSLERLCDGQASPFEPTVAGVAPCVHGASGDGDEDLIRRGGE